MIKLNMIREITKIDIGKIAEIGEHCLEVEDSMDKDIEEDHITLIITEITLKPFKRNKTYRGQNYRVGYRGNYRNDIFGRGKSRYRDRQYSDVRRVIKAVVGLDQAQELVPIV